ncbi:UDP-N-acetylglucosamine/UDP-glucose/GDP-mannose transporter isoform X2 [Rhinatrema bivittatum]|uniref:UDP-N-acetylglucosamine/UDP-glucose/GDP-mannose transporter isoform X2 n=1 Tax=Rhinatrema bivittatum TaxID=194408 RepID=UPI00112B5D76|nr:UDP-N-acetylglucosamine/UDP-glucose/GDP-mannose transporter isoform X2 [Rhinatrema bivittatum]
MSINRKQNAHGPEMSSWARLFSALFYGISSFLLVLINKNVLSIHRFPSSTVLGIGQMGVTIIILYVGKLLQIITFPDFSKNIPRKLFPLPLLYIGNHLTGLLSTHKLSLPMFTVLRKFAIPLTLILEMIILSFDLSFNLEGYIFVFLNDLFTAANGVYTAVKINPKELGKYGVLFYNASFMIIPTTIFSFFIGELQQAIAFEQWTNIAFSAQFLLSCLMGFILVYSVVLCCHYNSALTTTVVGAIKNLSVAYIGIFISEDYTFSWLNFLGLNICMAGGLTYSTLALQTETQCSPPVEEISEKEEDKSAQDKTCNS